MLGSADNFALTWAGVFLSSGGFARPIWFGSWTRPYSRLGPVRTFPSSNLRRKPNRSSGSPSTRRCTRRVAVGLNHGRSQRPLSVLQYGPSLIYPI